MCDRKKYEIVGEDVPVNRLVDEKDRYYVIVPRDPHVWCHIMIVLKKHREGLVKAQKMDLEALIEPVHNWTKILSRDPECDRVYLACLCDAEPGERHLHYHLIPVWKNQKVYFGHGLQWLGHLECRTEMMRFDKCSVSGRKARGKHIESMVTLLKEKRLQIHGKI